jgi:hypothetical protein
MLNKNTIDETFNIVVTDGEIYQKYTLPMIKEIALEVFIGLIHEETEVYGFFIPSMHHAITKLKNQASTDIEKSKDFTLANKSNHVFFLTKEYQKEIGNALYYYYLDEIKDYVKKQEFN